MRIKSTHPRFSIDFIREVVNFVKPSGVVNFDIWVKNSKPGTFRGRAYAKGTSFHSRHCPYVVIRIGEREYPFKFRYVGRSEAFPEIEYLNEEEFFVALVAHELRHLWQGKMKNKRGYYKGSKGKYSEFDCEMYALEMLGKWRKTVRSLLYNDYLHS